MVHAHTHTHTHADTNCTRTQKQAIVDRPNSFHFISAECSISRVYALCRIPYSVYQQKCSVSCSALKIFQPYAAPPCLMRVCMHFSSINYASNCNLNKDFRERIDAKTLNAAQHFQDCHRFSAGVAAGVTNTKRAESTRSCSRRRQQQRVRGAARRASDRGRRRRRRSEAAVAAGVPRIQLQQLSCCFCFCQQLTPFVQVSVRLLRLRCGCGGEGGGKVDGVDVSRFVLVCNFDVCTYMYTLTSSAGVATHRRKTQQLVTANVMQ